MFDASNRDRHYRALGLDPGASLQQIEESWRLRSAEVHPDKFPSESKEWATGKTQEINNARDELRRYWRERRDALQTEPEYELHVRRAPSQPEPVKPDTSIFEPRAAAGPSETVADRAATLAPGAGRGAVLAYATAALVALVILAGASAALLHDTGGGSAAARQAADPPLEAAAPAAANSDIKDAPEAVPASIASAEPQAAAADVPLAAEAVPETRSNTAAETDAKAILTPAPPPPDPGIQLPATKAGRAAPARRPVSPQPERAGAPGRAAPVAQQPSATSRASAARPAAQQATRVGRDPLVAAAIAACGNDLRRFCPGIQPGGGRLAQCAREHFRELSDGCSQALLAVRSARQVQANPTGR